MRGQRRAYYSGAATRIAADKRSHNKEDMENGVCELINVIGLGYIGLPTALALAAAGHEVVGTDINEEVVRTLSDGRTTFQEKGLDALFSRAVSAQIRFTTEYVRTDTYIVSVPTPYKKQNKQVDSTYIVQAVNRILDVCEPGAVLIVESTISPGTIHRDVRPLIESRGLAIGRDIHLAHAPERILPGNMLHELVNNNRTVGADDPVVARRVRDLYASFCRGEITLTDIRSAEMSKVVENTFRDINIAYANELAKICRSDGLDVYEIIRIANKHPRVNILQPGPGVGGHCISVDPWFLVGDYAGLANIILAARKINDSMPEFVVARLHEIMKEKGMRDLGRVGLYGLSYKEDVDDVRESPTLQLLERLESHLAYGVKVYDPYISWDIVDNQYHDFDAFLAAVDIVVLMVAHKELLDNMEKLSGKIVFDTKNVYSGEGVYKL